MQTGFHVYWYPAVLAALAFVAPACSSGSPTTPSQPGERRLSVSFISPGMGSVLGGTRVRVMGDGFVSGVTVTLGGIPAEIVSVDARVIDAITAPELAGAVDVVVSVPSGQSGRLASAFTYVNLPAPSVSALSESSGSTLGGGPFAILGANFLDHATARFGDVEIPVFFGGNRLFGVAPAHPAGSVDVTVINSDGQSGTLVGGYTYVPPAQLNFNGEWIGDDFPLSFTIQNSTLTAFSCGAVLDGAATVSLTLNPPRSVIDGTVQFDAPGEFTARVVTPTNALGTLSIAGCTPGPWRASRKGAQ